MKKLLVVVDMQNDFINGSLGSLQAEAILYFVGAKIDDYKHRGDIVVFSRDTHFDNYLSTQEGARLPVLHCMKGTSGHELHTVVAFKALDCEVVDKPTFGSIEFCERICKISSGCDEIEICGLCTDICVVSNALILKAMLPEIKISVDARACAGTSENGHRAALLIMQNCQIEVKNV